MDNEKNNFKVSNLYGRARRIELVEKIVYIIVGIVAIALVIFLVSNQSTSQEGNVNFAFLREYMENRGYSCNRIHVSGGKCVLVSGDSTYTFVRRDNGFEYIVLTNSYVLNIKHYLNEEDSIIFATYSDAFQGYRNKTYTCTYKDSVIGEFDKCVDSVGAVLDLGSYNGVVKKAMNDLNNIIESSGYDKEQLINNYIWKKS